MGDIMTQGAAKLAPNGQTRSLLHRFIKGELQPDTPEFAQAQAEFTEIEHAIIKGGSPEPVPAIPSDTDVIKGADPVVPGTGPTVTSDPIEGVGLPEPGVQHPVPPEALPGPAAGPPPPVPPSSPESASPAAGPSLEPGPEPAEGGPTPDPVAGQPGGVIEPPPAGAEAEGKADLTLEDIMPPDVLEALRSDAVGEMSPAEIASWAMLAIADREMAMGLLGQRGSKQDRARAILGQLSSNLGMFKRSQQNQEAQASQAIQAQQAMEQRRILQDRSDSFDRITAVGMGLGVNMPPAPDFTNDQQWRQWQQYAMPVIAQEEQRRRAVEEEGMEVRNDYMEGMLNNLSAQQEGMDSAMKRADLNNMRTLMGKYAGFAVSLQGQMSMAEREIARNLRWSDEDDPDILSLRNHIQELQTMQMSYQQQEEMFKRNYQILQQQEHVDDPATVAGLIYSDLVTQYDQRFQNAQLVQQAGGMMMYLEKFPHEVISQRFANEFIQIFLSPANGDDIVEGRKMAIKEWNALGVPIEPPVSFPMDDQQQDPNAAPQPEAANAGL